MKRTLISLLAVAALSVTGYSQVINTNTSPPTLTFSDSINSVFTALTTSTNWAVAPFMTYARDKHEHRDLWGGGLAMAYNLSPYAATVLRVDYLDKDWYMLNANVQLQIPFDIFNGNARMVPFGFVGAAQTLGSGSGNEVIGVAGAGWSVKFPKLSKHWSIAADAEYWTDRPGAQIRFSPFVWRF